ncbi:zinc finger B-box domain-containing protein 1 [Halichoeres trimaculatus]|uniref:zinc finger B-box domain-containing protein 1 n=1 Tax=Halichoeres trimaculatus TaxID=147232 RepID=UPI003D9F141D
MNLNDFMVVPNNKAKSVKLNARNLQDVQTKTVTVAQENEEMEEKLQQLKERMSKEKEERGNSAGFRWKSGQCKSFNNKNYAIKSKDNRLEKLSAGKVKMRVLKDEPLTVTPQPPLPLQPPTVGLHSTRKNRLRGRSCGQCEVKPAGLMCAECTEDYCISCFTKFHQKGALKLHRIIPIQTDLRTHVSTPDVVSCFQKHMNPDCCPGAGTSPAASHKSRTKPDNTLTPNASLTQRDQSPRDGVEAGAKPVQLYNQNQVLLANHEEKKETMKERPENNHMEECADSLLRGVYNEEESARSFQEALKQWREEKSDVAGKTRTGEAMWIPVPPVSVSATATQTDLAADRGTEGRERGEGAASVPVRVEFTKNGLTYLDRLLLKKHRRTPIETCCPSLPSGSDSFPKTNTEEEPTNSLTAEEKDFRSYFASLFAVPVSRCEAEPQINTPESCFIIEVVNEVMQEMWTKTELFILNKDVPLVSKSSISKTQK